MLFSRLDRCVPLLSVLLFGLSGCASGSSSTVDMFSSVLAEKWGGFQKQTFDVKTNPAYRYLLVQVEGRAPAFLVLGYVDAHPQGDIEVWYSSKKEVIKIQNGRIVATVGLEVDWSGVRYLPAPPSWPESLSAQRVYQRQRDEMPGYRYAITDKIESTVWRGSPLIIWPDSFPRKPVEPYTWIREVTLQSNEHALPPAWFAWGVYQGKPAVVYSEQCLSPSFCLKLQLWPTQESGS